MLVFRDLFNAYTVFNYDGKHLYKVGNTFLDLKTLEVYQMPQHVRDAIYADIVEDPKFQGVWSLHKDKFEEEKNYFIELHESIDLNKADFEPLQKLFSTYENFHAVSKEQIEETVRALGENKEIQEAPYNVFIYLFDLECFLIFEGEFYSFFEAREKFCNLPDFRIASIPDSQIDLKVSKQEEICKKLYDIVYSQDLAVQNSVFEALRRADYRYVMEHCEHLLKHQEPRNLLKELQELETIKVDPKIVQNALIALRSVYEIEKCTSLIRFDEAFSTCIRCFDPLNAHEISEIIQKLGNWGCINGIKELLNVLDGSL